MPKTNTILIGPIGTGKTTALRSVVKAEHPLFVLATEPGIQHILTHGELCHWMYVPPAAEDWHTLTDNAEKLNTLSTEQLIKTAWPKRTDYRQFIQLLRSCADFRCDECGEHFGPVDKLPSSAMFAIDGLSGLSKMSMDLVAGGKPIASQPEWGAAMGNIERLIQKLCGDTQCSFTLISHVEREVDEVTGGSRLMVSTLGRRLAPKIPKMFDEVIYCRRQGANFYWSSTEPGVDLKVRRLPFSDTIPPDFAPLLQENPQ